MFLRFGKDLATPPKRNKYLQNIAQNIYPNIYAVSWGCIHGLAGPGRDRTGRLPSYIPAQPRDSTILPKLESGLGPSTAAGSTEVKGWMVGP